MMCFSWVDVTRAAAAPKDCDNNIMFAGVVGLAGLFRHNMNE
jgi:hypothetical protein